MFANDEANRLQSEDDPTIAEMLFVLPLVGAFWIVHGLVLAARFLDDRDRRRRS